MTQKLENKAINQEITANVFFFIKIGTKKCQDGFLNDFQSVKNFFDPLFCGILLV